MVWYVLVSALSLYCFEIIGRYILYVLNIKTIKCCFGIGIIVFLAYAYITTSLITAMNGPFYLLCVIYTLFFIVSLCLIIKNRKNISFKINLVNLILLITFETILLFYAYNTSLGDLNGFDTTFYLNFVTSNIKTDHLNLAYYSNARELTKIGYTYTFQSFYYIASFICYIFAPIISIFHRTYYQTVYIWVFQIIFNGLFFSLIINSLDLLKTKDNKIISLLIIIFFIFVYGRQFNYNVFGFYGNAYRIITTGYSTLILYLLFESNKDDGLMKLFLFSLLGSAAVSSSSLFIDIFIMYAAYFILCQKYNDILKYYSFVLLFIITNLLAVSLDLNVLLSLIISAVISIVLFIFGNSINKFLSNRKVLITIIILSFVLMFVSSYIATGNIFDYDSFFVNYSEWADSTINYFHLSSSRYLLYLKLFILLLLGSSFFSVKKEAFVKFMLILFICIFNPFCSGIIYKVLIVYFRAFDIIVNPFTIILYINYLLVYFNNNILLKTTLCLIIIFVSLQNKPLKPLYYHKSFKPDYDYSGNEIVNYNNEFKMSQVELDVIDVIYNDTFYYGVETPYIITPNLLTQSFIPNGKFLFNRKEYTNNLYTTAAEKQLFDIFSKNDYDDYEEKTIFDYNKIKKYLKDAGIDYLVVNKRKQYYDDRNDTYSCLFYRILEDYYAMFDSDEYMVFRCFE